MVPVLDIAVEAPQSHREIQNHRRRKLGIEWLETGRVFAAQFGTPMDAANLRDRFYSDLKRLGLPRVTFHSLRKTATSVMASHGIPVAVIQAVLGHEKSSTTLDIYTRIGSSDLEIVRERLNEAYAKLSAKITAEGFRTDNFS
jgi:integrase